MSTTDPVPVATGRVFRGWFVVAGVFCMLLITAGLGFYGLPVYLRALTQEQGFSVGAVSGATAVFFLVSGVAGIPVASWMARHDPRPLVAAGAVVSGLSLVLLGRVSEVWQVYLAYALFGAGFAASSLIPGTTLVTRWFARRRSVALSVASTGLSAGGVLITPLMATLVRDEGLSTVAPYLGVALVLGVVPLTAWLLRPSPQALGLQPDGDPLPPPGSPAVYLGELAATALRSRYFATVTAAQLLAMMAQVGGIAHLYNLVADRRDAGLAATALSLLAASSLVGRLLGGVVATAVSMRGLTVVLMVAQGLALVALAAVQSPAVLLMTTVAFGLTVGNLLMLHPLLLAERFGVRDYAHIYSRSQLVATFGVALGPAFIGTLHDVVDGYGIAFAVAGAASFVGAVVLSVSGPTRVDAHVLEEAA
ncbi:MFS transporter [soil metagenome]